MRHLIFFVLVIHLSSIGIGQKIFFQNCKVSLSPYNKDFIYDFDIGEMIELTEATLSSNLGFDGTYDYGYDTSKHFPNSIIKRNIFNDTIEIIRELAPATPLTDKYASSMRSYCDVDSCYLINSPYPITDLIDTLYYSSIAKDFEEVIFNMFIPDFELNGYISSFGSLGSYNYFITSAKYLPWVKSYPPGFISIYKYKKNDLTTLERDTTFYIDEKVNFFTTTSNTMPRYHVSCDSTLFLLSTLIISEGSPEMRILRADPNTWEMDTLYADWMRGRDCNNIQMRSFDEPIVKAPSCYISMKLDADEDSDPKYDNGFFNRIESMQSSMSVCDDDVDIDTNGGRIAKVKITINNPQFGDQLILLDTNHYYVEYSPLSTYITLYPYDKFDLQNLVKTIKAVRFNNDISNRLPGEREIKTEVFLTSGQSTTVYSHLLVDALSSNNDYEISNGKIIYQNGKISIVDNMYQKITYRLFSTDGQLIDSKYESFSGYNTELDYSLLPNGLYMLELIYPWQEVKKFMISR